MSELKLNKANKEELIILSAIKVFGKKGMANAKIAEIAEEAGIGKGTVYEYFDSKEDILVKAIDLFLKIVFDKVGAEMFLLTDPAEKIKRLIIVTFEAFESMIEDIEFMMVVFSESLRLDTKKFDLNKMYTQYRAIISDILQEGIKKKVFRKMDTTAAAAVIIGSLDGITLQWILDRDFMELKKAAEEAAEIFIRGIKNLIFLRKN